jgi:hypothetical protein
MKVNPQNPSLPGLDKIQGSRIISRDGSPLSVGEVIEVQVLEKSGPSRFILDAKKLTLLAESDLPLAAGEKLTVKVQQLSPAIILRLLTPEQPSPLLTREHALAYLAKSEALGELFTVGRDVLDQKSLLALLPDKAKGQIRNILKIMDASVFSEKTLKNPMFVKDYISNLGLLLESSLRKVVEGREGKLEEGLKGALLKLSEALQTEATPGRLTDPEAGHRIDQLLKLTETSTQTIENHQVINVSNRENGGNYVLQLPILFPDGIRNGELFIEVDQDKNGQGGQKKYKVVMFLDMDSLGEVMIDASLTGRTLTCFFKVGDPETRQFISPFLDELKNSITGLGYDCGPLTCILANRIRETREEYHGNLFRDRCEINVLI